MTLSDLAIDIQARLMNGEEPYKIARDLEIPVDWVYHEAEASDDVADYFDEKRA